MPEKDVVVYSESERAGCIYSSCFFKEVADNAPDCINMSETNGGGSENDTSIENNDPVLVWHVGHGWYWYVTDNFGEYYICARSGLRMDQFKNRVLHLLSCHCGRDLAPALIENGTIACLAYGPTVFWYGAGGPRPEPCEKPDNTQDFYTFTDSDAEGEREMVLRGNSTGDAKKAMIDKFNEYIDKYETGEWKDRDVGPTAVRRLKFDRDGLQLFGDKNFVPCPCGEGPEPPVSMGGISMAILAASIVAGWTYDQGWWKWPF